MFSGTVLVLGATGQTGQRVVKSLRNKGIAVRALVRDAEKAESIKAQGVELMVGDLMNEADLRKAVSGVSAIISALGSSMQSTPDVADYIEHGIFATLEQLAAESNVSQIVLCSSMGTETPDMIPFLAPILRLKRKGELVFEGGNIPYTIVRPGGLVNDPGGQDVAIARTLTTGGRILRDDVAEVLVQAILQQEARNKIVEIIQQDGAGKADRAGLFA